MFRPTRSSKFSRYWVMVSPGCSEKNTVPPVIRQVTATHSLWIGAPRVCPSFVLFPCCHFLCIRSFVPCHWNSGLLRLVRLKEYGLGTQSLGLNCPLSEVGTPPPHNLGMAYGPVTENNTHNIGGTYARLVYTWYKNIFHIIAVLIVFLAANEKRNMMKNISNQDSNETETRQCYC